MNRNAASRTLEEKAEHGEAAPPTLIQQPRTIVSSEPHVPVRAGRAAEMTLSEDPPPSVGRALATESGRSALAGPNGQAAIPVGGAHPCESPSLQLPCSTRHPCMMSKNSVASLPCDEDAWPSLPERATLEACGIGILGADAVPGRISSSQGPRQREALGQTTILTGGAHLRKSLPPQRLTCRPDGLVGHRRDGTIAPAFQGHGKSVAARQVAYNNKDEGCPSPPLPEPPFQGISTHHSPDNRMPAENTGGPERAKKSPVGIGSFNESIGNDATNLGGRMPSGWKKALPKVPEMAGSSFPVPTTSEARERQGISCMVKPDKASPEKLPPTNPDLRNKGSLLPSSGAHVKPSAVPEIVPATGPSTGLTMDTNIKPRAVPEMVPATGPSMDSIEGSTGLTVDVADDTSPPMPSARDQFARNIREGSGGGRREHLLQQHPNQSLNEAETGQALAAGVDAEAVGSRGDGRQGSSQRHLEESSLAVSVPFSAHVVPEVSRSRMQRGRGRGRSAMPQLGLRQSEPVYEGVVVPSHEGGEHTESQRLFLKEHGRMIMAAVIIVVVLAVVVPTAGLMARPKSNDDEGSTLVPLISDTAQQATTPPSATPSSWRFFALKREVSTLMDSTAVALEDVTSPQHRALVWLADEDARQVDWQNMLSLVQRFVLAVLYFATGGLDSWTEDFNFLSSEHECNWSKDVPEYFGGNTFKGVECTQDNATVDHLGLAENNISGVLPNELGLLAGLQYLGLGRNGLSGVIPSSLGQLENLQLLLLDGNSFSGTLPISFEGLGDLQYLQLHLNELSGTIPTSLGKLTKLRVLALGYNQLRGTIPVEVNNLSKLEVLFLESNSLSGTLPITADSLQNLQRLSLGENIITGTIPAALFMLSSLTGIHFWGNALTGTLSPKVGKLTRLEVLEVPFNLLSGTLPPSLMGLSQLWGLSLFENDFTGTVSLEIDNLTKLQNLYLQGNRFGGTIPEAIGNLTELVDLHLDVNLFTGPVPHSFAKLKALGALYLNNNSFTGDLGFLCNMSFVVFKADCHGDNPEVACECCNICCSDELIGPVEGCFSTRN